MCLETALSVFFNFRGMIPGLLLSFTMAYAAYERGLKWVFGVAVICGIIESSAGADSFAVVMIAFTAGAALTYMLYETPYRAVGAVRAGFGAAVITAAQSLASYAMATLSFDTEWFVSCAVPVIVMNTAAAMIIYAALTKCFNIKETAKKLIIS